MWIPPIRHSEFCNIPYYYSIRETPKALPLRVVSSLLATNFFSDVSRAARLIFLHFRFLKAPITGSSGSSCRRITCTAPVTLLLFFQYLNYLFSNHWGLPSKFFTSLLSDIYFSSNNLTALPTNPFELSPNSADSALPSSLPNSNFPSLHLS